jgi:hypothetical protein
MSEAELLPLVDRRKVMGIGIAAGVALATGPTENAVAKPPAVRDLSPEVKAAFEFAIKKNFKSGPGYWAVAYSDDNFAGEPLLVGTPVFFQKPQEGTMPHGWGSKTGSIVVGPGAVLRLIHRINGQDSHITLLPCESMAQVGAMGIVDGQCSWKLYPAGDLRPPY